MPKPKNINSPFPSLSFPTKFLKERERNKKRETDRDRVKYDGILRISEGNTRSQLLVEIFTFSLFSKFHKSYSTVFYFFGMKIQRRRHPQVSEHRREKTDLLFEIQHASKSVHFSFSLTKVGGVSIGIVEEKNENWDAAGSVSHT